MLKNLFVVFVLVLVASSSVLAQEEEKKDAPPIAWKLTVEKMRETLKAGDAFGVVLSAEIAENWHLYALDAVERGPIPTKIFLAEGQPSFELGKIEAPAPIEDDDNSFNVVTKFYEESVSFKLPLKVSAKAASGKQNLQVKVRFQACSDEICLPPKTLTLETPVEIDGAASPAAPKAIEKPLQESLKFTDQDKSLIIKSLLEEKFQSKKQTSPEAAKENLVVNLSEKNISAKNLPKIPQVEFVLFDANEIKNYKGRELTYYEFEKIEFNGYHVIAALSVTTLAKGFFPLKSSTTYEYYKINEKWLSRKLSSYIQN